MFYYYLHALLIDVRTSKVCILLTIGGGSSWKLRGLAMHSEISLHARARCCRVYIVTVATHYK